MNVRQMRRGFETLEARRYLAASMWIDANTAPRDPSGTEPSTPVAAGSNAFFAADDGVHGRELWCTDGTAAGTRLVLDISPGVIPSLNSSTKMIAFNGKLFFTAVDFAHGEELWVSDGSTAGTHRLTDLYPGPGGASLKNLTVFGTALYFVARDSSGFDFLWRVAADESVTQVFGFGYAGTQALNSPFAVVNGLMYMNPALLRDVYVTDGTTAGTRLVKSLSGGASRIYAANGQAYFVGDDGTNSIELWRTDGTTAGTVRLTNLPTMQSFAEPRDVVAAGGKTYFLANETGGSDVVNFDLWITDGTVAGTKKAVELSAFSLRSAAGLQAFGSGVLFTAYGPSKQMMYRSDGTTAGTVPLTDSSGTTLGVGMPAAMSGGSAWVFGSTGAATGLYKLQPGASIASMSTPTGLLYSAFLVPFGGRFLFLSSDSEIGKAIWIADPATASSARLADIYPGTDDSAFGIAINIGGRAYFRSAGTDESTLWATDADGRNPQLLARSGDGISNGPGSAVEFDGGIAFLQYKSAADPAGGIKLWLSDGTVGGTRIVDLPVTLGNGGSGLISLGGRLFFSASSPATGTEMWVSDGTAAGTHVLDLTPGAESSTFGTVGTMGSALLFWRNELINSKTTSVLWRSGGTPETTQRVPGAPYVRTNPATLPRMSASTRDAVFYEDQFQLVRTDGTPEGTTVVGSPAGTFGLTPDDMIALPGRLFFTSPASGEWRLWTMGSTSGATAARVTSSGSPLDIAPTLLGTADDRLFFTAADTGGGVAMLVTDGTSAGTIVLQRYAAPPQGYHRVFKLIAANERTKQAVVQVYMSNNATESADAWLIDLKANSAVLLRSNLLASSPSGMPVGDRIAFVASDGLHGKELWITDDVRPPGLKSAVYDDLRQPTARFEFDEPLAGTISPADFTLVNATTHQTSSPFSVAIDATRHSLSVSLSKTLADGHYVLTLRGAAIHDEAANASSADMSLTFDIRAGDINRDGRVDFDDLVILAQNYGKSGQSYAQGNLDYSDDGLVNFGDLVILAQRYNTGAAMTIALPPLPTSPGRPKRREVSLV